MIVLPETDELMKQLSKFIYFFCNAPWDFVGEETTNSTLKSTEAQISGMFYTELISLL